MREPGVRKGISTREGEGWFSWCHSVLRWLDFPVGWIPKHNPVIVQPKAPATRQWQGVQTCTGSMLQIDLSPVSSSPVA